MTTQLEAIDCVLCGRHNDEIAIEENGYVGRRCADCSIVYISPRPSFSDLVDMYSHGEAHTGSRTYIATVDRLRSRHHVKLLKKYQRSGTLLEIGAGSGSFVDEARRAGFKPHAIELNQAEVSFIRGELKIPCEDQPFSDTSFGGMNFNVIYHCNVTSHFYDLVGEFEKMRDRLTDGGIMMFETGNVPDLNPEELRNYGSFQYPDHLFFLGADGIRKLLDKSGFETIEVYGYSMAAKTAIIRIAFGLRNVIRRLRGQKPAVTTVSASPDSAPAPQSAGGPVTRVARVIWGYALHFAVFGLGALDSRQDRARTLVCVARKKAGAN